MQEDGAGKAWCKIQDCERCGREMNQCWDHGGYILVPA